jgi:hypothetical protein
MKNYLLILSVVACVAASCSSSDDDKNKKFLPRPVVSTQPEQPAPSALPVSNANAGAPQPMQPQNQAVQNAGAQTVTVNPGANAAQPVQVVKTPVAAPATGKGLNPPHGQPGHRCDIAVGAPLDSKPNAAAAPPQPAAPVVVQQPKPVVVNQPAPAKTAPGMNPPHGQPGHRCDIAVGAPLNSKPVTPAVQPAVQEKPVEVKKDAVPSLPAVPKKDSL